MKAARGTLFDCVDKQHSDRCKSWFLADFCVSCPSIHIAMRTLRFLLPLIAAVALLMAQRVPFTNRRQLALLPDNMLNQMALTNYKDFLGQNKLSTNATQSEMVRRVGTRISKALATYYRAAGREKELADYKWEFNLVDDPTINAWCMPGGKVVVFTGLLPVTQNEDALAAVMGHEIAHAVARHGNERMTQGLAVELGGMALNVALSNKPAETRNLFLKAYGAGSQLGLLLPYSRKHETEADEIGLYLMAMAGYKPSEAPALWGRMEKASGGSVPAFLSTHPAPAKRAETLKTLIPKAEGYARKYPVQP